MVSTLILLAALSPMDLNSAQGDVPNEPPYRTYSDHKKVFSLTCNFSASADAPIMRFNIRNLKHVLHDPSLIKRLKHHRRELLKRDGPHMMINSIVANLGELHAGR